MYTDLTDRDILTMFLSRDERALEAAAQRYEAYLYTVAIGVLGSHEDAEECVNDTWLKAWNSIPPNEPEPLLPYLARITRNTALDRRDRQSAAKRGGAGAVLAELDECVPDTDSVVQETPADEGAISDAIDAWLRTLDKRDCILFVRRYFASEDVTQLAARLELTPRQAVNRLSRLRQRLKKHLEKEGISI